MNLFDSHVEAGQMLGAKDRQAYYAALVEFVAYGKEPQLKGAAAAVMTAIMPNLIESRKRSIAGAKGGSTPKKGRSEPQSEPQSKAEANTEANPKQDGKQDDASGESETPFSEKAKGKGNKEPKGSYNPPNPPSMLSDEDAEFAAEALGIFNAETGSGVLALDPRSWDRLAVIRASGRTLDDVRAVVRSKHAEWRDDDRMRRFIRPSTLFGDKFEEYLAAASKGGGDFAEYD